MVFGSARCTSKVRLDGKCAIITGCNTGIGKWTAKDFFERGARVIMACRNKEKAQEALEDIKKLCEDKQDVGELVVVPLDVSSLQSIRNFAKNITESERSINLLINNAGVMLCPLSRTEDGFEMQFGTNHLGHFLLTLLLLPKIINSAPARIVNVSSRAHITNNSTLDFNDLNWEKRPYSPLKAYQASKLANILFTKELARKLKEHNIQGVNTYSLHPGVVRTDLGRHLSTTYFNGFGFIFRHTVGCFLKTPEGGAQTTIHCAVDEKCAEETGLYYSDCKVTEPAPISKNEEEAKALWDASWKLVKLSDDYNPFVDGNKNNE